jgi:hypothetical protein
MLDIRALVVVVVVVAEALDLVLTWATVMQVLADLILFRIVVLVIVDLQELQVIPAVHIGMALAALAALLQYRADLLQHQTAEL